jgi:hypothetical protein
VVQLVEATSPNLASSISGGVSGFFIALIIPDFNINEYQEYRLGVKVAGE